MEVPPVRSKANGSSDFSIERILAGESRSHRESLSEPPSWLCCTRYRPPRLPRVPIGASAGGGGGRARRSGRHARVPFTGAQAAALEAAYARAPYLAPPALRALAAALHLRDDRIKIWFQNRRARERREKSVNILPPHTVTLAPTTKLFKPDAWFSQPDTTAPSCIETIERRHTDDSSRHYSILPSSDIETFKECSDQRNTLCRAESPLDIESVD